MAILLEVVFNKLFRKQPYFFQSKFLTRLIYNAIKAPQWYAVQGSDTTMMTMAAFSSDNKNHVLLY